MCLETAAILQKKNMISAPIRVYFIKYYKQINLEEQTQEHRENFRFPGTNNDVALSVNTRISIQVLLHRITKYILRNSD